MRTARSLLMMLSTIGVISLLPHVAEALPCCSAPICEILHKCQSGCLDCARSDDDSAAQTDDDSAAMQTDDAGGEDEIARVCYLAE